MKQEIDSWISIDNEMSFANGSVLSGVTSQQLGISDIANITSLTILRDRQVLWGNKDGKLGVFNPDSGYSVFWDGAVKAPITSLQYFLKYKVLMSTNFLHDTTDSEIKLWGQLNGVTYKPTAKVQLERGTMLNGCYCSQILDDYRVVVGDRWGKLRLLDVAANGMMAESNKFKNPHDSSAVRSLEYVPCRRWLVAGYKDKTIKIWSVKTNEFQCVESLNQHDADIMCLKAWDNCIVSGDRKGVVRVWNTKDLSCERVYQVHHTAVRGFVVLPEGLLVSVAESGEIKIFDVYSKKRSILLQAGIGKVFSMASNAMAGLLVVGGKKGLHIWDIASLRAHFV